MLENGRRFLTPTGVTAVMLLITAFIIFQPIVMFLVREQVDYANHLSYLQETMDTAAIGQVLSMFPHFVYHLSVYTVFKVFSPDTIPAAALAVSIWAYLCGTLAVFWLMIRMLGKPHTFVAGLGYGILTLALMLLMPIDIFTPNNLFVGYIGINAYHNPTIVLLKPFAVILFWCSGTVFQKPIEGSGGQRRKLPIWMCALASILCVMAKSSYVIALLPALMVVAGYRLVRRQPVDWTLLMAGIIIPASVILVLQIVFFQSSEGFIFAPLAVIYSWTRINLDAPNGMVWKFLLSILFPLLVYLAYFKVAVKHIYLNLAWVVFAFGAAYMYLLAEGGERLAHANFTWCAISTLFILFIISTTFLIQQIWGKAVPFSETMLMTIKYKNTLARLLPGARLTILGVVLGYILLVASTGTMSILQRGLWAI